MMRLKSRVYRPWNTNRLDYNEIRAWAKQHEIDPKNLAAVYVNPLWVKAVLYNRDPETGQFYYRKHRWWHGNRQYISKTVRRYWNA